MSPVQLTEFPLKEKVPSIPACHLHDTGLHRSKMNSLRNVRPDSIGFLLGTKLQGRDDKTHIAWATGRALLDSPAS